MRMALAGGRRVSARAGRTQGGHCGHPGKRSWRFAWTPRGGGQDARTFERPSGRSEIIPRDARALSAGDAHKGVAARLWRYFPGGKRQAGRPTAEQGVCGGGSPGLGVGRTAGRRRVPSARAAAPTEAPAAASSIGGAVGASSPRPRPPGPGHWPALPPVRRALRRQESWKGCPGGLPRPHAVPRRPALPTPRQAEPWEAGWDPSPRRRRGPFLVCRPHPTTRRWAAEDPLSSSATATGPAERT